MEQSKVSAIENFPTHLKKNARSFLGLTGYYREFIPQCASIVAPLTDLTRKMGPKTMVWTPACDQAFWKLKELLCLAPVLSSHDFGEEFILQPDASNRGVGAVLSQVDEEGDQPVAFFSLTLLPWEERILHHGKIVSSGETGSGGFPCLSDGTPVRGGDGPQSP